MDGQQPEQSQEYSYPLRTSLAVLITRVIGVQVATFVLILILSGPLVVIADFANDYLIQIFLLSLILLILITVNTVGILLIFFKWIGRIYMIRSKEIVAQTGIWSVKETIYSTERIGKVDVQQSIWGKLFNYGTILVIDSFTREEFFLENVPDPFLYADVIKHAESKEKTMERWRHEAGPIPAQ